MRDKSAPIPTGDAPALPRLSHLFSLFEYTGRAFALVLDTSRAITAWLGALSAAAGLLPAAIAYVGKLIVDAVVHAAQAAAGARGPAVGGLVPTSRSSSAWWCCSPPRSAGSPCASRCCARCSGSA